jgi:tetratricopeptide (TPR) repeat protein
LAFGALAKLEVDQLIIFIRNPHKRAAAVLVIGLLAFVSVVSSEPYMPQSDAQILERLPLTANSESRELRVLRRQLMAQPEQLDLACMLAERYIALGRQVADPRYYGYAQSVLQPWWQLTDPPSKVLLLRVNILQNRHDFAGALQDLQLILQRDPRHAQAWLAQAVILQVRARYDEAKRSCLKLIEYKDTMPAIVCLTQVGSLTGQAGKSYDLLRDAIISVRDLPAEQQIWSLTVLAEMAVRLSKPVEAEHYFKQALQLDANDTYLLTAYADFLLDQNRLQEVMALLTNKTNVDALLLRRALAEQRLASPNLASDLAKLQARFAASRLRGENLHQGDEARMTLFLLKQPRQALQLALANWQAQREPKDARILLEAALAAESPDSAKPVLDLLSDTGMEDNQLKKLASRFSLGQSGK